MRIGKTTLEAPREQIEAFCRHNGIRRLSLFGSVLRGDFGPDSDVDLLVEFRPEARVGYLDLARMEGELSAMFGQKVDLRTPLELSRYFREEVMASAEVLYDAN